MKDFNLQRHLKLVLIASLLFAGISNSVNAGPVLLQDAYTNTRMAANQNYGNDPSLKVAANKTSFLQFAVNSYFPTGIVGNDIAKATLKIFVNSVNTAGSFNVSSVVNTWAEDSIKGNNQPSIGTQLIGPIAITSTSSKHWISIDITNQVKDWLDGISNNNGLVLVAVGGINVNFDSKESSAFSHAPEIDIIMESTAGLQGPKGDAGPAGAIGATGLTGATGVQGLKGDTGLIGATGLTGATGVQGLKGDTGPIGATGLTGAAGSFPGGNKLGDMQYWNGTAWVMIPVGSNFTKLTLCDGVPTWASGPCPGSSPYQIGETGPAGGIVFYITTGGLNGMEAALQDQGSAEWGCAGTAITGADGKAVGTGVQNTADIVAGCNEPGIAAKIADDYTYNGYTDWFLPSNDELNLMWTNIGQGAPPPFTNVGGFANNIYWSSSESGDTSNVLIPNIYGGATTIASKNTSAIRVRAIRAF